MSFREEMRRARKDNGPQNINTLRQSGHNLLKNGRTLQVGIQGKRRNAGWEENCLLKVLLGYDAIALGTKAVRRPQALNQWYYADCVVGRNPTCR